MTAFATVDAMADALVKQHGIGRDTALAIARKNVAAPPSPALLRDRPISEAEEQRRIRRTAIEHGAKVYWLSQARKTQQTAGIPDLWIAFPTFGMWVEVKAEDGKLSAFQEDFRDECHRNGTRYFCGTHDQFCVWLESVCVAHADHAGVEIPLEATS